MLRTAAKVFGVVFILIGILGFVPALTPDGNLLGLFKVNAVHNFIHLASGIAALYLATRGEDGARLYFRVFGVVYGLVTLLGILMPEGPLLGIVAHNPADIALHAVITAASLALGFGPFGKTERAAV